MYREHNMNHSDCLLHDKKKSHQMSFHFLRLGGWLSLAADDSTNSLWLYCSLGASHLLITRNRAIKKTVFKVI